MIFFRWEGKFVLHWNFALTFAEIKIKKESMHDQLVKELYIGIEKSNR